MLLLVVVAVTAQATTLALALVPVPESHGTGVSYSFISSILPLQQQDKGLEGQEGARILDLLSQCVNWHEVWKPSIPYPTLLPYPSTLEPYPFTLVPYTTLLLCPTYHTLS